MKRTLVVVAAVVGFATAAGAATLNVFTTNSSNVATSTFNVGDTILLKVTGDSQGDPNTAGYATVELAWNSALTTYGSSPLPLTQGNWYVNKGNLLCLNGDCLIINQTDPVTGTTLDTSVATMVAAAVGTTNVSYTGTVLSFFGLYQVNPTSVAHSFTIIPEPTTAALIGLGLFGLALGGRRRA